MRAAVAMGDGTALTTGELPEPTPGKGEALIAVEACGMNFADGLIRDGKYQEKPTPPFAPGAEVAGRVVALGEGAPETLLGKRVVAVAGHGGMAERATAPAFACAPIPDSMSSAEAAALPVAYGTSHMALDYKAKLQPGERLLVFGAAGGVGLAAVEIGALMGAEVIACARGLEKLELAKSRGATHLFDSESETLVADLKAMGGVDVVYDPVGGAAWEAGMRAARFEARLIPIGFAGGAVPQIPANILLVKNLDVIGLNWGAYVRRKPEPLGKSLAQILAWAVEGKLRPHVDEILPLDSAQAAVERIRARRVKGKLIIDPRLSGAG